MTYHGIPVMASNMDTVGTFEMAKKMSAVCIERPPFCYIYSINYLKQNIILIHLN